MPARLPALLQQALYVLYLRFKLSQLLVLHRPPGSATKNMRTARRGNGNGMRGEGEEGAIVRHECREVFFLPLNTKTAYFIITAVKKQACSLLQPLPVWPITFMLLRERGRVGIVLHLKAILVDPLLHVNGHLTLRFLFILLVPLILPVLSVPSATHASIIYEAVQRAFSSDLWGTAKGSRYEEGGRSDGGERIAREGFKALSWPPSIGNKSVLQR